MSIHRWKRNEHFWTKSHNRCSFLARSEVREPLNYSEDYTPLYLDSHRLKTNRGVTVLNFYVLKFLPLCETSFLLTSQAFEAHEWRRQNKTHPVRQILERNGRICSFLWNERTSSMFESTPLRLLSTNNEHSFSSKVSWLACCLRAKRTKLR